MTANTLLIDALADRTGNAKGCLADQLIHNMYGQAYENKIAGLGYNNNMFGFVMALDNIE
jgi:hypothetical protein